MDSMDQIVNELQKFNFSKMEAQVYITIVRYSGLNGSQVAKLLNSNRGSVYSALNSLYEKGAVFLLPGDTNVYQAQKPEVLIETLKERFIKEFNSTAESLKKEFAQFQDVPVAEEQYYNIKGHHNFVLKTKELLFSAEEEVYINTNYSLRAFSEELKELSQRGVRIVVYSNEKLNIENLPVEYFSLENEIDEVNKNMLLVIDSKKALIASGKINGDFLGTFTDNQFMVEIISEHIHYDIYLMKLEKKYGISWFDKLEIKTRQEEKFLAKLEVMRKRSIENKKMLGIFKK